MERRCLGGGGAAREGSRQEQGDARLLVASRRPWDPAVSEVACLVAFHSPIRESHSLRRSCALQAHRDSRTQSSLSAQGHAPLGLRRHCCQVLMSRSQLLPPPHYPCLALAPMQALPSVTFPSLPPPPQAPPINTPQRVQTCPHCHSMCLRGVGHHPLGVLLSLPR